jgi:hypothetical protein
MNRTEDLLNDNGPSPSMSIASNAPQKQGGSKSDGLDKDHIAVSHFSRLGTLQLITPRTTPQLGLNLVDRISCSILKAE